MNNEEYQQVEGFDSIISFASNPRLADFRGPTQGWSTEIWWKVGPQESLAWNTAACPKKETTVFTFVGMSANLPYGYIFGNQAEALINGEHALSFHLGIRRAAEWQEGDFQLEFIPKSVSTPFEGYHRDWEIRGNCGIYRLTVPERCIELGKGVRIDIKPLPQEVDCITWFMVTDRKDALQRSQEALEEEITSLKADYVKLKNVTNALARMVYRDHFPDSKDVEHTVIWSHPRNCIMKADVLKLSNGELLVAFREGPEHRVGFSPTSNGRVCTIRSPDNGRTWGQFRVVAEEHHEDHRDPSLIQLRDGMLLMNYVHSDRYDETGTPLPEFDSNYHSQVLRSYDGGHTWEKEPVYVDHSPFATSIAECKCLELPNGRILMPMDNVAPKGEAKAAAVLKSDDRGESWQYLSTICAADPHTGAPAWPCEPSLARTGSGRIVAIMRTQPPRGGKLWQSFSEDEGVTWSEPWETPLYDFARGELLLLGDGRLVCSIGYRGDFHGIGYYSGSTGIASFTGGYGIGTKPGQPRSAMLESNGIRAAISNDEGASWGPVRILRDDFPNSDIGYPASVELDDGRIFTVYWYNLFDRYFIGGSYWRV